MRSGLTKGHYLRSDVARLTGISTSTLIRWHKAGIFEPMTYQINGSVRSWLYTEDQVETLLSDPPYQKQGRPPKEQESTA